MRIPLAPPGYKRVHVQDLSWSEDRKTKAVAVEFRTLTSNEPLYVTYRLEPDWTIEDAAFLSRYRFSNLLGFYPWPDPAMADIRNHVHLKSTPPTPGSLTFDGQELETQRYAAGGIVVDVAFLPNVSLTVARPRNALALPALTSEPYESLRPEIPPPDGGYFGFHEQGPGGDFQR
jgi:hypothetical protein